MDQATSPSSTALSSDQSESTLESLAPDLYQRNAFRIAELPVDASERDLTKRQQTVAMAAATGLSIPPGPGRALPITEAVDPAALGDALHRLREPVLRLVDEFFWFWPHQLGQSKTDEALLALARGDIAAATERWRRQADQDSEANVSIHNLAVLAHATALDMEQRGVGDDQASQRRQCWLDAFSWFRTLLEDEGFWRRLTARIRDLDDPRLTTGTARRFRAALPLALLSFNAQLAVQAAERGDDATARRQVALMREAGFPKETVAEALQRAVEPLRRRIKALCAETEKTAIASPELAEQPIERLIEQTRPLLNALDILLPIGHATRDGMHDEVALTVLGCDIPFSNRTKTWDRSLKLLERALPIAASRTATARIRENIEIDRKNLDDQRLYGTWEEGTCWFCQKSPIDERSAIRIKMHGEVTRRPISGGTRLEWRTGTVDVPRCTSCREAHRRHKRSITLGWIAGLVVGLLGCVAFSQSNIGFIPPIFAVLVFAIVAIGYARASDSLVGARPENAKLSFPLVKRLTAQGWSFGEKPASAQQ